MLSVRRVSLGRAWLAAKFTSRGDIPSSTRTGPACSRSFGKGYVVGNGRTASMGRRNDALSDHGPALLQNRLKGQLDEVSGQAFKAFGQDFRARNPVRRLEDPVRRPPSFRRALA